MFAHSLRVGAVACVAVGAILLGPMRAAHADGSEMLGLIDVAPGSDIIMAGVGLRNGQPDSIEVTIPAGVTVEQVLLYWEGFALSAIEQGDTDTIMVNGVEVTGDRIGGPNFFFSPAYSSTYRAELATGLLDPGANSVLIGGLDFGNVSNGAGLLVVVDDGVNTSELQVADGDDTAYFEFPEPRKSTAPVTYTFAPAEVDRPAGISLFAASVFLDACRPNVLRIWVDDALALTIENPLESAGGAEWDTYMTPSFVVPAGAPSITAQLFSENLGNLCPGANPASMVWIASALTLEIPDEPGGGEGCTPGYWRQMHHCDSYPMPYECSTRFNSVFEDAFGNATLRRVAAGRAGGSNKLRQLGKHTVAALLNAQSPDVSYPLTADEVIMMFNAVYPGPGRDYVALKDFFEMFNDVDNCPLN